MDWPGKRDCLRLIQQSSTATLKPCREESVDFDTTENLFIEGDNLEVLKLLQKSYYGQVKMIYIDPPYNTGKEFIYPDNFSESLDTYLQYAGLKDSEGRTFSTNTANEGRFHTKWLNMMYPRLYLARNLLREDGVIFISIDDNEVENLRRICNEIFGEENFIATIIWQKRTSPDSRFNLGAAHDYVLVYGRSELGQQLLKKLPLSNTRSSEYKNRDNDPRGPWASVDLTGQTGHATKDQFFDVVTPSGMSYPPPDGRCWALAKKTYDELYTDNRLWFGKDGNSRPRLKKFLSESQGVNAWTWWGNSEVGDNQSSAKEIKKLLGSSDVFDNPKPTKLIHRMLQLIVSDGDIVLDFFAGSGTTGHAAVTYSIEKNISINFILVQLPEKVDPESPPGLFCQRQNLPMNIASISKERLRRAFGGESAVKQMEFDAGVSNSRSFKVLKLDQSNFKLWQAPAKGISDEELLQQMELNVDHIDPNASQEDLLYELLIKAGVMPTEKVEQIELAGHQLFSVADGTLLVHLENRVDQVLIDAVLNNAPSQFICLDKAFHGNDQLKTNAVKTFQAFNQGKEKIDQIDFKTV
ncbi:site-specific DNA-methyltransferase [Marinospirillum sp.]|uniref:site-specific DNA-methyltransferase n=1 Tax=Marinospirillum sp. TaxID=2183934 RepID=UPI0025C1E4FE|nr:site-specific DNA-methyltransferase [Marinospirillum sp.]